MRRGALIAIAAAAAAVLAPAAAQADAPPAITGAVATSYNDVRVQFNEPVNPASVQPGDFALQMAAVNRSVDGVAVVGDGSTVMIHSPNTWDPGQAGYIALSGPGVVNGAGGAPNDPPSQVHVGGAPGDFTPPVVKRVRLLPSHTLCLVKTRRCQSPGGRVTFFSSEDGYYFVTILRGRTVLGVDKNILRPGDNFFRFDGKVNGHPVRPGKYRMAIVAQDVVGNTSSLQRAPSVKFSVRRS